MVFVLISTDGSVVVSAEQEDVFVVYDFEWLGLQLTSSAPPSRINWDSEWYNRLDIITHQGVNLNLRVTGVPTAFYDGREVTSVSFRGFHGGRIAEVNLIRWTPTRGWELNANGAQMANFIQWESIENLDGSAAFALLRRELLTGRIQSLGVTFVSQGPGVPNPNYRLEIHHITDNSIHPDFSIGAMQSDWWGDNHFARWQRIYNLTDTHRTIKLMPTQFDSNDRFLSAEITTVTIPANDYVSIWVDWIRIGHRTRILIWCAETLAPITD